MLLTPALLMSLTTWATTTTELVSLAADKNLSDSERRSAFSQMVELGEIDDLLTISQDEESDARERWVAIRALGKQPSAETKQVLKSLLADDQPAMRAAAASALGDSKDMASTEDLVELLHDPAMIVRGAAADALAELADLRALPDLEQALKDQSNYYRGASLWVRRHYVDAVVSIGSRSSFPVLADCLEDTDPNVVQATIDGLEQITGISYSQGRTQQEELQAWRRWLDAQ